MELQCIQGEFCQRFGPFDQAGTGFEWQAKQQVPSDEQAAAGGTPDSILGAGEVMAAQAFSQNLVVTRFDADLKFHQHAL